MDPAAAITRTERTPSFSGLIMLAFIAASFLLYLPVLDLSLLSDDHVAVWHASGFGGEWWNGFHRPLSELTLRMGCWLFGTGAIGHRAFNITVHGINAFLILVFFLRTAPFAERSRNITGAWMAALLFLVYPFHAESIIWIVGRGSSLATCFVLLALIVADNKWSARVRITVLALLFFAGSLTYESALLLPIMLLPLMWWRGSGPRRQVVWMAAALGFVFLVDLLLRSRRSGAMTNDYGADFFRQPLATYLTNVPKVIGRLFLPPDPDTSSQLLKFLLLLLLIGIVAVLMVRSQRRENTHGTPLKAMGWLLLVSCALPVLGSVSTQTSESDRFLYMPSAFLACVIAIAIMRLLQSAVRWIVFSVLVAGSLFFLRRNEQNWTMASDITRQVLADLRSLQGEGELGVTGLPDEHDGAFIFRHGFEEALLLQGFDTAQVRKLDGMTREKMNARWPHGTGVGHLKLHTGDTIALRMARWEP